MDPQQKPHTTPPVQPAANQPAAPQIPQANPMSQSSASSIYPEPTAGPMASRQPEQLLSKSEAEAIAKREEHKHRLRHVLAALLIAILVAGLAGMGLSKAGIVSLTKFKAITYDNGRGSSFHLTFYSKYSTKTVPGSTKGLQELVSKDSVSGLYPLTLNITKGTEAPGPKLRDCDLPYVSSETIQVTNKPTGNTMNLCSAHLGGTSTPSSYIGVLQSGTNYYALMFSADVDFAKLLSSPQNARTGLQKIDLSAYNEDIKTIAASVKPL